ncbi:hypothetical protein ACWEQ0_07765 [Nocardia thailandica]|uniref:Uncharacterized protein n=1 Tax=Nocardia thailandica TaxID=257275 RepID=A0ABW6PIF5_9NOCA
MAHHRRLRVSPDHGAGGFRWWDTAGSEHAVEATVAARNRVIAARGLAEVDATPAAVPDSVPA